MEQIVNSVITKNRRDVEEECQYKGKNGKFCRMTTNESCRGCEFYNPNYAYKIQLMAKAMEEQKAVYETNIDAMKTIHEKEMMECMNTALFYKTCGTGHFKESVVVL